MIALILLGFALLFFGGEFLVRGSVGLARRLGLSELFIGLTLVGFGTSAPELVTSLRAIHSDAVGIAVGNVIGSNVANILLVLGVAAILRPIFTQPKALMRDSAVLILATLVFIGLIWFDSFSRLTGMALFGSLVVYIALSFVFDDSARTASGSDAPVDIDEDDDALWLSGLFAIGGILAVVLGAEWLVKGGTELATILGVSEAVIGLSVVAIGTSLPELAAVIASSLKGKSDVALGGIIGSNIFNILSIMGISAMVFPFSVMDIPDREIGDVEGVFGVVEATSIVSWDHIGALVLSLFMMLLFAFTGKKLARWEGFVMLLAYAVYMGLVFDMIPAMEILPSSGG